MRKYVFFISKNESKVFPKEFVNPSFIKEMKLKGFRRHHIEVEAIDEREAIDKLAEQSEDYLTSLKDYTGNVIICCICFILSAIIYFLVN